MKSDSSGGPNRLYNLVSIFMVILTVLALCGFVGFAAFGPKAAPVGSAAEPTLFRPGSPTPTLRYPTPQASWTASASPTITVTSTASRTPVPSETATPTDTATATSTLTASPSSTPTQTAIPPTRSAFDFVLKGGTVTFTKYKVNTSDCGTRIGGAVFNKSGGYMTGLNIHITGPGADARVAAGSHTEYGAGGYEYFITNVPVARAYNVQLEYPDGALASEVVSLTTKADCNLALALVSFQQVQDRQ